MTARDSTALRVRVLSVARGSAGDLMRRVTVLPGSPASWPRIAVGGRPATGRESISRSEDPGSSAAAAEPGSTLAR